MQCLLRRHSIESMNLRKKKALNQAIDKRPIQGEAEILLDAYCYCIGHTMGHLLSTCGLK